MTGHNNLLYHLHNMDPLISPTCRFCLDGREEFSHLAHDCPALWWERLTISSQDPNHSHSSQWTPRQILDFTFFSRIDDAFAKPLFQISSTSTTSAPLDEVLDLDNPVPSSTDLPSDTDTDISVMETSSASDSSSQDEMNSNDDISVDSDFF